MKPFSEKENRRNLELYLHIPFCVRKCSYCDFLSMPAEETLRRQYVDMLLTELREKGRFCRGYQVSTVFFGGGTPSLLSGVQIAELMEEVRNSFSLEPEAEITLECNPGTLDRQKLLFCRNSGINRLSMGLQSASNRELELLGRIHTFEEFLENFALARKMGFENINLDLISGLPRQTVEDWRDTLEKVLALRPEHISAYSLMVEEGTPFFEQYGADELRREQGEHPEILPEEETEREMYELTRNLLEEKGYHRYEISNYARTGRECRHNTGYWQRVPYLGLGLGSASLMEEMRFSNPRDLETYLKGQYVDLSRILQKGPENPGRESGNGPGEQQNLPAEVTVLDKTQQMEEFMFLGLRMTEGISRAEFRRQFGMEPEGIYGASLQKFQSQGLVEQKEGRIFLTEAGIGVSNYVLSGFLVEQDG